MLDVATFLMRWMFLSNILRNVAEIQTFPQQPVTRPQPPPPPIPQHAHGQDVTLQENHWRNHCLQTILSYPPGKYRLLIADAYRIELVQRLARSLAESQECLRRHRIALPSRDRKMAELSNGEIKYERESASEVDPDADLEILRAIQQQSQQQQQQQQLDTTDESQLPISAAASENLSTKPPEQFTLSSGQSPFLEESSLRLTPERISHERKEHVGNNHNLHVPPDITPTIARQRLTQLHEYLPQLVSAVLKSPPAVDPSIANPIHLLRQQLLSRCAQDPSWGIELCWQLEADVGRAWKALLEHPQQTGRRLFVILPAEKAAVLAKIGYEKSAAFDLLQGAEQATAFGGNNYLAESIDPTTSMQHGMMPPPKETSLPSSLRQRRCAHFGDTMHFVDRLTKLSLDLRRVPVTQRQAALFSGLKEMNRRIRRRMVTRGEVSLDMEDNFGPDDWPRLEDLTMDMLHHSVHFPLVPQTGAWPTGANDNLPPQENLDVVRVLNIVVEESRLLSSRERCPFLVQLEVADTGIEGHDARLYTVGASSVGSTVQEAVSMNTIPFHSEYQAHHNEQQQQPDTTWSEENRSNQNTLAYDIPCQMTNASPQPNSLLRHDLPRGGSISSDETPPYQDEQLRTYNQYYGYDEPYQINQQYHADPYRDHVVYQGESTAYGLSDLSGFTRQRELQELHVQLHVRREALYAQQYAIQQSQHSKSRGTALLDQVFGIPWAPRCAEIKKSSPFGKVDGWRLASFIMKAGEDIRKEALVMQIISRMRSWFDEEIEPALRPIMRPYTIMSVGGDAGLVECLSDAKSVDEVKKKTDSFESLRDFFIRAYGPPGGYEKHAKAHISFEKAQDNFLRSLVGYSLVCYVLQIKDRHNANILLDRDGHVMHIDFGFVLGDTPKMGKVPIFSERAPFKLSAEFWDVLGGWNTKGGGLGVQFCKMFAQAFACASKHAEEIGVVIELSMLGLNYDPRTARLMANGVRTRLRMRGPPGSEQQQRFIVELVSAARACWGTTTYDWLQKNMNGYQ